MKRKYKPILPVSAKERATGVRVIVFEGWSMKHAAEDKAKWFSKRKHLIIIKEKQKTTRGRGKVVGPWVSNKIYVAFIPKKKKQALEDLKQKQEPASSANDTSH